MCRLLLLALIAGCQGRAPEPAACETVASRFFSIALAELGRSPMDDALRRGAANQLPALRDALVHVCTRSDWSAGVRDCMASAADRVAFEACELQLTEAQRASLDEAAVVQSSP
jgi:hypothetical protein